MGSTSRPLKALRTSSSRHPSGMRSSSGSGTISTAGSRTSCLGSEDVSMKPVSAIARKTLRMILEASRDMYPREFGAILRAEEGTITELILVPGTVSGKRHAIFQLHTLPADFSVVGTVHSHPSGVYEPSDEDLALFNKFGGIHIITGYPYAEDTWAAWTNKGKRTDLKVVA